MLAILESYHCMHFHRKLKNQTNENGKKKKKKKKTNFGPNFDFFGPNLVPQFFFSWVSPLLDIRHCCKLS